MKTDNTIGADKYFHCKANCEATLEGPWGKTTAEIISGGREATDMMRPSKWREAYQKIGTVEGAYQYKVNDMNQDLRANEVGRSVLPGGSCRTTCDQYRVNGINPKY